MDDLNLIPNKLMKYSRFYYKDSNRIKWRVRFAL